MSEWVHRFGGRRDEVIPTIPHGRTHCLIVDQSQIHPMTKAVACALFARHFVR
jgi:hypothetical protein